LNEKPGENFADARARISSGANRTDKLKTDRKKPKKILTKPHRLRTRNASARKRFARRSRKAADRNAANLDYTKTRNAVVRRIESFKGNSRFDAGGISEKDRLEKVGEATTFIRETLKEAAPRVAKNYVFHVSMEANQMFVKFPAMPNEL
jgi:hypothetical protein